MRKLLIILALWFTGRAKQLEPPPPLPTLIVNKWSPIFISRETEGSPVMKIDFFAIAPGHEQDVWSKALRGELPPGTYWYASDVQWIAPPGYDLKWFRFTGEETPQCVPQRQGAYPAGRY